MGLRESLLREAAVLEKQLKEEEEYQERQRRARIIEKAVARLTRELVGMNVIPSTIDGELLVGDLRFKVGSSGGLWLVLGKCGRCDTEISQDVSSRSDIVGALAAYERADMDCPRCMAERLNGKPVETCLFCPFGMFSGNVEYCREEMCALWNMAESHCALWVLAEGVAAPRREWGKVSSCTGG